MEPFSTALLAMALFEIARKLAEKGVVDPALEKGLDGFKKWLTGGYDSKKADAELRKAFSVAIKEIGAPIDDRDEVANWLKGKGLDRLQSGKNDALRKQVALALIGFTGEDSAPPADLVTALGWPRSRIGELSALLGRMRAELAGTSWQPLFTYAEEAQKWNVLRSILAQLSQLGEALVETPAGEALRVVMVKKGLTLEEVAEIEGKYRQKIMLDFENLETRGLSPQLLTSKPEINLALKSLPLESIYLEPGLIPLRSEREREAEWEEMLQGDEAKRLMSELRQQQKRVSDALAASPKLVVVGKPGSGKTVSLKFIALMLARGQVGASRLRLDIPFIPVYVRLAQYAEKLKSDSGLALEKFLLDSIGSYHYPGELDFNEFLGIALDKGLCALLLDGLDEVGDVGDTLVKGKTLRSIVLAEVQRFTRQRCGDSCSNRVVVTSRLEGYHRGDLDGFDEMELSALSIPDEVREFLLRWFAAHEQKNHPNDALDEIYRRAQLDVDSLMTDIMRSASVQRLAINPLLLTILAMIHKLGTRLPNERVKLYQIVTQTMVESWRQAQTRGNISIYEVLKASRITPMMASLAYWVHENHPGGAMPETEWKQRIQRLLQEKDDEMGDEAAAEVAEMFMRHAREEVGLLIERSPGQIGLFHLTLEEYLAGVEIASRKEADRRAMLAKHWKNPRWREAILLAAGQLMLNGSQELDTFVLDLRMRDDQEDEELLGLPALMAGSAIADVGAEHFMKKVVRETRSELATVATMFSAPATRRAECADLADELGYDPGDLYAFVPIRGGDFAKHPGRVSRPGTAEAVTTGEFYLARYPVTNLQYERFLRRENFEEESLWRDFPKYDEKGNFMPGQTWGDTGWKWLQGALKEEDYLIEDGVLLPRYWRDPRFGIARKSAPVVGISWYEANAYCRWLAAHWQGEPEAGSLRALVPGRQGFTFRLPTEAEWVTAAGGDRDNRFAWGLLEDEKEISRYANTDESGVNRTTPVWAYPQGESPLQVMDMSGNVWEWMANFYDKDQDYPSVRGGSWYYVRGDARVSVRSGADPYVRDYILGFRGVFAPHLHHNSEL